MKPTLVEAETAASPLSPPPSSLSQALALSVGQAVRLLFEAAAVGLVASSAAKVVSGLTHFPPTLPGGDKVVGVFAAWYFASTRLSSFAQPRCSSPAGTAAAATGEGSPLPAKAASAATSASSC
mmetsp:Transcript_67876/g.116621  ORF Transcript_67876/g.116621 Transcript_67876/m.116621 type:complete len:124 (-) Transcript_67876:531-902(-)